VERDIIRQVCNENDVDIIRGVLSSDHVHMFVSAPPKLAVSDLIRLMKWRWSHKVQREFPQLKKRSPGTANFLGQGVLFNQQRCHHRRHRTAVPQKLYF
jgi:putative transposase